MVNVDINDELYTEAKKLCESNVVEYPNVKFVVNNALKNFLKKSEGN